jgi:hypothetical protein
VVIQLFDHAGKKASQQVIAGLTAEIMSDWSPILAFQNTTVQVRAADLLTIARLPDVVWLGERFPREMMDEVQTQILAGNLNGAQTGPSGPGYKAWLDGFGFSQNPADYPIVSVGDDGVGNGTTANGAGDVTLTQTGQRHDDPHRLCQQLHHQRHRGWHRRPRPHQHQHRQRL